MTVATMSETEVLVPGTALYRSITGMDGGKLRQRIRIEVDAVAFGNTLLLSSAIFFSFMSLFARSAMAYYGVSAATMVLIRGVIQTALALFVTFVYFDYRQVFRMSPRLLGFLALRGFAGGSALALCYCALSIAPLGAVTTVFFLNPVFTLLLSSVMLGESVGRREILASALCFLGVALVSRPGFSPTNAHASTFVLGLFLALVGAVMASLSFVSMRFLASKVHFMTNVLSYGIAVTIIGLISGGASTGTAPSAGLWIAVVGSVAGFIGQSCVSKGFEYTQAGVGSLLRTVDVPTAYIFGLLFLQEMPAAESMLGSALVVSAIALAAARRRYKLIDTDRDVEIGESNV